MLVLITEVMVLSRLGLTWVQQRAAHSLWSVTLFRDTQTADIPGNGALRKKFRGGIENFCGFFRLLWRQAGLGGSKPANLRAKIIFFG
jgi:hypothetical protein